MLVVNMPLHIDTNNDNIHSSITLDTIEAVKPSMFADMTIIPVEELWILIVDIPIEEIRLSRTFCRNRATFAMIPNFV